jgi:zinc protease
MRLPLSVALSLALAGCAAAPPKRVEPPAGTPSPATTAGKPAAAAEPLRVPVEQFTLDNGLRVVLSRDPTAPTVVVALYYNIGFRVEPRDRTGFAHLFEHMMFQGSANLGKMEFVKLVEANGGLVNGSTNFDFTNYYEVVPANTLETMLWAEADRLRGLAVTQDNLTNQQGVVKSEVRVNVLNQAYGGFPWLDMPQYANKNWHNAHNFYGALDDLDHATLADVKKFFQQYYAPNNAALVIVGDLDYGDAKRWVQKYFADIPKVELAKKADVAEPRQEQEIKAERVDPLADRPAVAIAYHVPDRGTPEWYAFALINELLVAGRDSALYQKVVQEKGLAGEIAGGVNLIGNQFNYAGPMLWIAYAIHDRDKPSEALVAAMDEAIEPLRREPVAPAQLARARIKVRARLYDAVEQLSGFGRADLLASYALFDGDAAKLNQVEGELMKVDTALIHKTAVEYLRPTNRTILKLTLAKKK